MSLLRPLFPAAAINKMPSFAARIIEVCSEELYAPPPHELLKATILKPCRVFRSRKYSIAAIASDKYPPVGPRNFPEINFTFQAIPAIPIPSPPFAPIVPAT
jgi:hypothetical protein